MQQLEFKFFWPLQEQIALDLDDYLIPSGWSAYSTIINSGYLITSGTVSGGVLTINTDEVVFHTKQPQSFFQRWFFRLLGLRVEQG
jgi:hypothetical protein